MKKLMQIAILIYLFNISISAQLLNKNNLSHSELINVIKKDYPTLNSLILEQNGQVKAKYQYLLNHESKSVLKSLKVLEEHEKYRKSWNDFTEKKLKVKSVDEYISLIKNDKNIYKTFLEGYGGQAGFDSFVNDLKSNKIRIYVNFDKKMLIEYEGDINLIELPKNCKLIN